eukprot:217963_1
MPEFIIEAAFQTLDTASDVLFAIFITLRYHETKHDNLLYTMIGCYLFIVVPIAFSIGQLVQQMRNKWVKEDDLRAWLASHSTLLYLLSILTGSAYTAVRVANSGAFQMDMFSMGLNKKQRIQFNTKRVYGIVICENIPQVAMQIWYLVTFGVAVLPVSSIILALIAIIITVLSLITQKSIIDNQQFVKISFNITGDDIKPALSTKTNDIKIEISRLLGIRGNLVEIPKPQIISEGLKFEVFLFINNAYYKDLDYESIMNMALNEGKLLEIFKNYWEFSKPTVMNNLRYENVISEVQQNNMVVIEANNAVELIEHGCNSELKHNVNNLKMPSYIKNPSFNATKDGYSEVEYTDESDNEGDVTLKETPK